MDNVKKFIEQLKTDAELQKKVKAAQDAYKGDANDEAKMVEAVLAPIAKEVGLPFSVADFNAYKDAKTSEGEASDDELAAVAGGGTCVFAIGSVKSLKKSCNIIAGTD